MQIEGVIVVSNESFKKVLVWFRWHIKKRNSKEWSTKSGDLFKKDNLLFLQQHDV